MVAWFDECLDPVSQEYVGLSLRLKRVPQTGLEFWRTLAMVVHSGAAKDSTPRTMPRTRAGLIGTRRCGLPNWARQRKQVGARIQHSAGALRATGPIFDEGGRDEIGGRCCQGHSKSRWRGESHASDRSRWVARTRPLMALAC